MGKKILEIILFFIVCSNVFADEFSRSEYYVKEDGSGTKDGTSWANAMPSSTFAKALSSMSTLKSGVTFHLAAGTYYPMYDPFPEEHVNYSDEEKECFKVYYVQTPINIIGGYSKNPKDGEKPNPSINETIISGDVKDDDVEGDRSTNINDDLYNLFNIDLKEKDQCSFFGLTLKRTRGRKAADDGVFRIGGYSGYKETGSVLKLDRCIMLYVSKTTSGTKIDGDDELIATNCTFERSYCQFYNKKSQFNSCTFIGDYPPLVAGILIIKNCTFYDCCFTIGINKKTIFHNNTIVNNVENGYVIITSYSSFSNDEDETDPEISLIGNIFDCKLNCYTDDNCVMKSRYNLYREVDENMSKRISFDYDYIPTYIEEIFEKNWEDKPILKDNGGYTKTIKLISDQLPEADDCRSIRFDKKVTNLATDQRGVTRLDNTCMGSYEKNYTEITIPTAFTPFDSNNKNDVFMQGYEVYIYDIYGMLVTHTTNGWNGKVNGEMADAGIYIYAVKLQSGEIRKGSIELLMPR